jgi:lipoprotein-anchoring transpeptidase ErfK/SrfK
VRVTPRAAQPDALRAADAQRVTSEVGGRVAPYPAGTKHWFANCAFHQAWRPFTNRSGAHVIRVATCNVASLAIAAFLSSVATLAQESPITNSPKVLARQPQAPRETGYAHVEINLSRQRLFVVDESGRVVKTLPVSSGNGRWFTSEARTRRAITPTGRFTVFRKIAGWRKSPLGMLYYPSYIIEGVAIHGSRSVPSRPASHGCIRIPMSAAKEFSDLTPIGTIVLVY